LSLNKSVNVKQNGAEIQLLLAADNSIAQDAAWIAGGIEATTGLGDLIGEVEVYHA
jgi:hypothetical protein